MIAPFFMCSPVSFRACSASSDDFTPRGMQVKLRATDMSLTEDLRI